ncbi:MAG TPA: hypothetical protein VGO25_06515, partial [Rhodanobacteraceae bacterium]|nr:hypothetical protein [Rhodanobacteraceae bacterium]
LRAQRATIESTGVFWLLKRALTGDAGVPAGLDVRLHGASFSDEATDHFASEGWFGATSLVPFESVGCEPVTTFSARDYARMGITPRDREDELRYTYDASGRVLRADIESTAPPFSAITAHLELSAFEPTAWFGDARAANAQRIEQFSLTYLDGGYLAKRNRFCAQLTGTDAAGYAARHLAAVKAFLAARGVVPGDEVSKLFGKLVEEGGSAEISSLPEATFTPAEFAARTRDDVLRDLNVTLRHNTAPPILMRLAFTEPPENAPTGPDSVDSIAAAIPGIDAETPGRVSIETAPTETVSINTAPTEAAPIEAAVESEPAVETSMPPPTVALASQPKSTGMPLLSAANAAVVPVEPSGLSMEVPPADAEIAKPEPPISPWTIIGHPIVDPREAVEAIPASAPPPPPDSIAALVWRAPTIERLPEKSAAPSSYVSIPTATLGAHIGSRVRLMTAGGKLVEGRLQQMDASDVVVLILRDGGSAQMRIPQAGVRDAMVRRSATP